MKKAILLLMTHLFLAGSYAQSWISSNAIFGNEDVTIIKSTSDNQNNIILLGHFLGTLTTNTGETIDSYGGRDYFICKFDQDGSVLWLKNLGSNLGDDTFGGIIASQDGNIFITGNFLGDLKYSPTDSIKGTGGFDIFLAKIDTDGNYIWIDNYGAGSSHGRSTSLNLSSEGNIVLGGTYRDSIQITSDTTIHSTSNLFESFYTKIDSQTGSLIWAKSIRAISGNLGLRIFDIATSENSLILTGVFTDSIVAGDDTVVSINSSLDAIIIKTNSGGDVLWNRTAKGTGSDLSVKTIFDSDHNIYLSGIFNSNSIQIQTNQDETFTLNNTSTSFDIFIVKYDENGNSLWIKGIGGSGDDKIADAAFFNNEINISGLFTGTLNWGGIQLSASSATDQDMFIGAMSLDGNFRSANSFGGRNNSVEDARSIFSDGDNLYTVIRSNSDLLVLGNDIYTNPSLKYFVAFGKIGCLPINITASKNNVTGCYGDETGTIFVGASGGLGGPFRYSIDNGDSYQNNDPNFSNLAAGVYNTVVVDKENCAQAGPVVTITEPTEITISNVTSDNVLCNGDNGSITVEAAGGTGSLFYSTDGGTTFPTAVGAAVAVPAGNYNIAVRDGNSCQVAGPALEITQPNALEITGVETTDLVCYNDAGGAINITVTGGTAPYNYSINGGTTYQPEAEFGGLDAGTYTIKITDENDCELTRNDVMITQPDVLVVTVDDKADILCNGDDDGSITLSATGGTTPYEFSIDSLLTQSSNNAFNGLAAGVYDIFVTDAADCLGTAGKTEITQPDTLKIILISQSDITSSANGEVVLEASGGTEPYTFTQQPEGIAQATGTFTFTAGQDGVYSFELDDANNCGPVVKLVQINDLTNITEQMLKEGLIYPNPSTGQFIVEMNTAKTEMLMEIITIDGKVVLQKRVFSSGGKIYESVDLSSQTKGIYMIRMDNKTLSSGVILQ